LYGRRPNSLLVRDYVASPNPVEFIWAWLKRRALANYCPDSFSELQHPARGKFKSAQRRSVIIASCRQQAALF
jgi:hypothetical protein